MVWYMQPNMSMIYCHEAKFKLFNENMTKFDYISIVLIPVLIMFVNSCGLIQP